MKEVNEVIKKLKQRIMDLEEEVRKLKQEKTNYMNSTLPTSDHGQGD